MTFTRSSRDYHQERHLTLLLLLDLLVRLVEGVVALVALSVNVAPDVLSVAVGVVLAVVRVVVVAVVGEVSVVVVAVDVVVGVVAVVVDGAVTPGDAFEVVETDVVSVSRH